MFFFKKIYNSLEKKNKFFIIFLVFLITISTFLESISLAIILPLLQFLTNQNIIFKEYLIQNLFFLNDKNFIYYLFSFVVFLFIFKMLFLSFYYYLSNKFVLSIQAHYSEKLFKNYMLNSWKFHLNRNSSLLVRNCIAEINVFGNVIYQFIQIISEILIIIGLAIMLIILEVNDFFSIVFIIFISSLMFYLFFKNFIINWGSKRLHHDGYRYKNIQQAIDSIKLIKILKLQSKVLEEYRVHNLGSAKYMTLSRFFDQLPRVFLEVITVLSLIFFSYIMINDNKSNDEILVTLGLFIAASFRFLPSINRILNSFNFIKFSKASVSTIINDLDTNYNDQYFETNIKVKKIDFKKLEISNLNFFYNNDKKALKDINLFINKGEIIGIYGASGSGKSTLVDCITGLHKVSKNTVLINGIDIEQIKDSWQKNIGYITQNSYLIDDTIKNNIVFNFAKENIDQTKLNQSIEYSFLNEYISSLPSNIDTHVGEKGIKISGGQKQRICIARAMYKDPEFIIFDEATSSLDYESEKKIIQNIKKLKKNKTIIIIAHRLKNLSICDKLIEMKNGKINKIGKYKDLINE